MLKSSLKNELTQNVRDHNSRRKEKKEKEAKQVGKSLPSLIYDVQGHNIKRVWEKVFASEVNNNGRNIWSDISTVLAQNRDERCDTKQQNKISVNKKHGLKKLLLLVGDFAVKITKSKKDDEIWNKVKKLLSKI